MHTQPGYLRTFSLILFVAVALTIYLSVTTPEITLYLQRIMEAMLGILAVWVGFRLLQHAAE